jgi:hypothetical protein
MVDPGPQPSVPARRVFPYDFVVFAAALGLLMYAVSSAPEADCDATTGPSTGHQVGLIAGVVALALAVIVALASPRSSGMKALSAIGYLAVGGPLLFALLLQKMADGLC